MREIDVSKHVLMVLVKKYGKISWLESGANDPFEAWSDLSRNAHHAFRRAIFCQTYKQGVYHCHIFSFEVNIGGALTAEAKTTPGNDEADERELHLSSIVAGVTAAAAFSCSSFELTLMEV
ncbi:hypothetical protein CDAR_305891 [Caerostris darwini]|uniref:Uncharacterized protein n=1 Tax=Caerostris darwini TaxID=1538125 RepID=A0AAV4VRG6_9ARAC|nr:hypothetical protein CDAR_305891 [Caerostris darwini]